MWCRSRSSHIREYDTRLMERLPAGEYLISCVGRGTTSSDLGLKDRWYDGAWRSARLFNCTRAEASVAARARRDRSRGVSLGGAAAGDSVRSSAARSRVGEETEVRVVRIARGGRGVCEVECLLVLR
ncbi:hypothetical protein Tco_0097376 [Tanacetum coccineum]